MPTQAEIDVSLSEASVREYAQQWARYPMSQSIAAHIQDVLDQLADLRARFEASQAALGQAVKELERAQERAADMELQRDQSLYTPCFECGHS